MRTILLDNATTESPSTTKRTPTPKKKKKSITTTITPTTPTTNSWIYPSQHRVFFDKLAQQLNITKPEDWYHISPDDIAKRGGASLLRNYYKDSLFKALSSVYPDVRWLPWQFAKTSRSFWSDLKNQRQYFDWLAEELQIRTHEDWYAVSREDVEQRRGRHLLKTYYQNSLFKALSAVYPEHHWQPWRFARVPNSFWRDASNLRQYLDWLGATKLGIEKTPDDWYRVRTEDFERHNSSVLSHFYDHSLLKALTTAYPEVRWEPWRFTNLPRHTIATATTITTNDTTSVTATETVMDPEPSAQLRGYMEHLAKELSIRELDDWYRVSKDQVSHKSIIENHGGLVNVLRRLYPQHDWNEARFHANRGKKSTQRWLIVLLQKLFPGQDIVEEYEHPQVRFQRNNNNNNNSNDSDSDSAMQLDIWLPSLGLAFEYHGEQHFHNIYFFGNPSKRQERDEERIAACARVGITLIIVPYWWDRTIGSIAATILKHRPDLATKTTTLVATAAGDATIPESPNANPER